MAMSYFDPRMVQQNLDKAAVSRLAEAAQESAPPATTFTAAPPDYTGGAPVVTGDESTDYGTPAGILRDPWVQRGLFALGGLALGYGIAFAVRKR